MSQQIVSADNAYYPTRNSCFILRSTFDQEGNPPYEKDFGNSLNYSSSIPSSLGDERHSFTSEYSTLDSHLNYVSSNANSRHTSAPIVNNDSSAHQTINYEEHAHRMQITNKCPSIRTDHDSNRMNTYQCGGLSNLTDCREANNNMRSSTTSQQAVSVDRACNPTMKSCFGIYSTFNQEGNPPCEMNSKSSFDIRSNVSCPPWEKPSMTSENSSLYNHSKYIASNANSRHFPPQIINYDSSPCIINYNEGFGDRIPMTSSLTSPIDKTNGCSTSQVESTSKPDTMNRALTRGILGGKCLDSFPEKLFQLLDDTYKENKSDIVSFLPHGRAFVIYKQHKFIKDIAPKYFRFSKLTSFQRQLNMYGFRRVTLGSDAGAYYHTHFLRENPSFCTQIKRVKSKEDHNKNTIPLFTL